MNDKLKIYIGCALTNADPASREKVKTFKESLKDKYEVLEFLGLDTGTAQDVYHKDIQECVAGCDIFLAFCDITSSGLGYKLGTAIEKYSKPVLAVAHKDADVSRLILGIDHPMYHFARYNDMSEVSALLEQKVQKHFPVLAVDVCATDVCAV